MCGTSGAALLPPPLGLGRGLDVVKDNRRATSKRLTMVGG